MKKPIYRKRRGYIRDPQPKLTGRQRRAKILAALNRLLHGGTLWWQRETIISLGVHAPVNQDPDIKWLVAKGLVEYKRHSPTRESWRGRGYNYLVLTQAGIDAVWNENLGTQPTAKTLKKPEKRARQV